MLFGMIQFGLGFTGWDQLRNAVQTGARLAASNEANPSDVNCGQSDPGQNMVCQIALLIGAPLDTSPNAIETSTAVTIPSTADCSSPLASCSGPNGYAWLDGYYIFTDGQWLQIVNTSSPISGQITDSQALQDGVGTWTCSTAPGSSCTSLTTNVTGQNQASLGSDGLTINVDPAASQLEVCVQRQVISFTALPGLQGLHLSTTSTFYIPSDSTVLGCGMTSSSSPPCIYQSANGVVCG